VCGWGEGGVLREVAIINLKLRLLDKNILIKKYKKRKK
jgi:hypothetical protein